MRKNLHHFRHQNPSHYLILAGDQLYRMDLKKFLEFHKESKSDITVACTPVTREDASGFGIMKIDSESVITDLWKTGPR
nr:sugar phosphate nucleotidyltransferase [Treponema sp. OMZ 791]